MNPTTHLIKVFNKFSTILDFFHDMVEINVSKMAGKMASSWHVFAEMKHFDKTI